MAWDTLSQKTCAIIIEAIAAPDLGVAFLGKDHVHTAGNLMCFCAKLQLRRVRVD
jgi:hypothetical protein